MSAAEKLKGLDTEIRADDDAMGELSVYAPWLLAAFPQIVAVVEAAQNVAYNRPDGACAIALTALDEALGDVT